MVVVLASSLAYRFCAANPENAGEIVFNEPAETPSHSSWPVAAVLVISPPTTPPTGALATPDAPALAVPRDCPRLGFGNLASSRRQASSATSSMRNGTASFFSRKLDGGYKSETDCIQHVVAEGTIESSYVRRNAERVVAQLATETSRASVMMIISTGFTYSWWSLMKSWAIFASRGEASISARVFRSLKFTH